jgi:TolB-like protein
MLNLMTAAKDCNEIPTAEESRAAMECIAADAAFRRSPQLVAFLRFVVESTLAGKAEHIKSYTIGVEAFGRSEHFDPQVDPIVRVEAARLRKALACYFAGDGAGLPVSIEIPLGCYIPKFSRRRRRSSVVILLATLRHRLWRRFNALPGYAALSKVVLLGGLTIVGILAVFGTWSRTMPPADANDTPASGDLKIAAIKPDRVPLVLVQPVVVSGVPTGVPISPEQLQSKLLHTLARFDEIKVVMEPSAQAGVRAVPPELRLGRSNYRVRTTLEYRTHGAMRLLVLLDDIISGRVVWANTFDVGQVQENNDNIDDTTVGDIATILAQPYGVIYAQEVANNAVNGGASRYGCVLQTIELRRIEDTDVGKRVRACLERATTRDPKFADGFAALSLLDTREYYLGDSGDRPLADRAVETASRAIELKPQSARAHEALSNALFARGDIAYALRQGEIAVAMNPNDMTVLAAYGMRLAASGRIEEGAALVSQAAERSPVPDLILNFTLFACAYLLGDDEKTAHYASAITGDTVPLALLVHALAAARAGDQAQARQIVARLSELDPSWRTEVHRRLQRFIPSAAIVDRIARDIGMVEQYATR